MDNHSTTQRQDWETPTAFFEVLTETYGFQWDMAATAANTLCENFYHEGSPTRDALLHGWPKKQWLFCNPPWSNIGAFLDKGYQEALQGAATVFLLPARLETNWYVNTAPYVATTILTPRMNYHDPKRKRIVRGISCGSMLLEMSPATVANPETNPLRVTIMRIDRGRLKLAWKNTR